MAYLPFAISLWHHLRRRGRFAGAEGRHRDGEEDGERGGLQRPESGHHQPDRLRHDRSARRHHLRHAQEDWHQCGTAGDGLGVGGAASGDEGAGGGGGWSIFHTWFTGGFILNPVVTAPFRGLGAAGWFGWYENPKIEELTQAWLDAEDADERLKIAMAIQLENYAQVPTVNLGQFQIPTAYRKSLTGKLEATGPLFWNVRRV